MAHRALKLGCIADDFTGATDLASTLVRHGLRVVQTIGVPASDGAITTARQAAPEVGPEVGPDAADEAAAGTASETLDADALVVALKSRTTPAAQAVAESLAACRWLRRQGAQRIYFKICSTFDSTPRGNIGPVLEALMDELGSRFALISPALPENGRSVVFGHLFVGASLLSDSPMRHHPLTPMSDANLIRVLQAQLDPQRGRKVSLIDQHTVSAGPQAIASAVQALIAQGCTLAIGDALGAGDLRAWGAALHDPVLQGQVLLCGGSGLAGGFAAHWASLETGASLATGHITSPGAADALPMPRGHCAIVAGSCSAATLAQVEHFMRNGGAARALDPLLLTSAEHRDAHVAELVQWCRAQWAWPAGPQGQAHGQAHGGLKPVLIYSSAAAKVIGEVQQRLGADEAGALIEQTLGQIARALVAHGAQQLIVAGGETSGACVQALGIEQLRIGPQIDPGIPWCHAHTPLASPHGVHIALKSGNFGSDDFFSKAFLRLHALHAGA